MSKRVFLMFSSKCFIVSGLIFRSLIHLEFIFVNGVMQCSHFILLYVAVQFSQHHLLKRLSFLHLYVLASFVVNQVTIYVWLYLWDLYPVPLIYISVFVPLPYCLHYCSFVVQSELRDPDSSSSVFLSKDCFVYSGSFVFPYKL